MIFNHLLSVIYFFCTGSTKRPLSSSVASSLWCQVSLTAHSSRSLHLLLMQKCPLLPPQLQTTVCYARKRTNRRVRKTPQPFPASSFPVPVSTQLKPQNKPATNKSRIGGVAESPHPDSVKIYDYPFLIIKE